LQVELEWLRKRRHSQLRCVVVWWIGAMSVRRQCELLGLARSSAYYEPESEENLALLKLIDRQYLKTPFFGSRRLAHWLKSEGHEVNRKRVRRLMQTLGLEAVYPKPKTTVTDPCHRVCPYLLRGLKVESVDQVWSTDITYVPMLQRFLYLTVVIDWFSRCVLAWRLSNSLDNVFVERLWRTVKYEEVDLKDYADGKEAARSLAKYFRFYCHQRPHSSLGVQTPAVVYATGRRKYAECQWNHQEVPARSVKKEEPTRR
jgi:putative transposase